MGAMTRRCAVSGMIAIALAALPGFMRRAAAQTSSLIAAPEKPATVPITPARGAAGSFLDLYVRSYSPPRRGAVEAVVTLGPAGNEIEIGRFAVFPSEPFLATNPAEQRAYRFDATAALAAYQGRPLVGQVRLLPVDPAISAEGAQLGLSRVEITPRP